MNNNFYFNRLSEGRKQELSRIVNAFPEEVCLYIEDLFRAYLMDADNGTDRSNDILAVTFDDECGHELELILSQEEVRYVADAVTEKLDNIGCDCSIPFGDDETEDGTINLTPVNTEEEFDMLLTHLFGDAGGGAYD